MHTNFAGNNGHTRYTTPHPMRAQPEIRALAVCVAAAICCFCEQVSAEPTRVLCEITENGREATGVVSILKDDKEVATGSCGREVVVPTGEYVAALRLDGSLDGPEQRQTISVSPKTAGSVIKLKADFTTATLEVRIASSGRRAAGMAIIKRNGQQLGTLGSGVAAHLSTGTYRIFVRYRTQEKDLGEVTLAPGQQRVLDAVFE